MPTMQAWDNAQVSPSAASTAPGMVNTWMRGIDVTKSTCSVEGCEREHYARRWCEMHYQRWQSTGTTDRPPYARGLCSIEVCGRPALTRGGMCNGHRHWSYMNGGATPTHVIRPRLDPAEMLRRKSAEDARTGCVNWLGRLDPGGYGRCDDKTTGERRVHRVAWALARGPIPEGMTIDHLCWNKVCINVNHLEVVTRAENSRRSNSGRRTHCTTCTCSGVAS